jgi:hypothetical protein
MGNLGAWELRDWLLSVGLGGVNLGLCGWRLRSSVAGVMEVG